MDFSGYSFLMVFRRWARECEKWREKCGELEQKLDAAQENERKAWAIVVEMATRPAPEQPKPVIVPAQKVDVAGLLREIRHIIVPDIPSRPVNETNSGYSGQPSWTEQALDNDAGVTEKNVWDQVPDFVLAFEGMDPNEVRHGGWLGAPQSSAPDDPDMFKAGAGRTTPPHAAGIVE